MIDGDGRLPIPRIGFERQPQKDSIYHEQTAKNLRDAMEVIVNEPLHGEENILLIDDEPAFLDMMGQILNRFGYQVSSHHTAEDALNSFGASPDQFDLVITDLAMPGINGSKLVSEIRAIRPDMPVILCTGVSEGVIGDMFFEFQPDKVLNKPAEMKTLLKNIRGLLDD